MGIGGAYGVVAVGMGPRHHWLGLLGLASWVTDGQLGLLTAPTGGAELPSAVPTMRVRLAQIAGERQPAVGTGGEPPRDRNRMRYFFRVSAVNNSLSKNSTK